jgi:hypothetical protein
MKLWRDERTDYVNNAYGGIIIHRMLYNINNNNPFNLLESKKSLWNTVNRLW